MTVKINASALGIKEPVQLEETIGLVEANLVTQIKLEELDEVTEETTAVDFLKNQLEALKTVKNFVKDTLHLTAQQVKKMNELSQEDLESIGAQITGAIMHVDENDEEATDDGEKVK